MHAVQLTIGLPPERLGGTEVYVASLIEALQDRGCTSDVVFIEQVAAGPRRRVEERRGPGRVVRLELPRDELPLDRLLVDDQVRAQVARAVVDACLELRPDILHIHPLTVAVESEVVELLRRRAPVALTYHTATASCLRGDLLLRGAGLCDGRVEVVRCRACSLSGRGLPRALAPVVGGLAASGWRPDPRGPLRRLGSAMQLARQPAALLRAWDRLVRGVDAFVAGSEWVRDLLASNGVPPERIVLCLHGTASRPAPATPARSGALRFGFVGRFRREKGAAALLDALERLPSHLPFELEVLSPTWLRPAADEAPLVARARALAARDPRLRLSEALPPEAIAARMAQWDALVVPSLAPEVGPLVVLEAQRAGLPIIGSRRAGIAERVRDGVSGALFEPGDARALARRLEDFASAPETLRRLRAGVLPPRTFAEVAREMLELYHRLAGGGGP